MRHFMTAGLIALTATPALAGTTCTFALECYEAEACAESTFTLDVTETGFSSLFGDMEILNQDSDAYSATYYAMGPGARYLLSTAPDGGARFTVHTVGPQVVSYLGQCREE